jgi:hypothetical protein
MQGPRNQSLVPVKISRPPPLEATTMRVSRPVRFGLLDAARLCSYSLARMCSDLVDYARSVNEVRNSVHYNI